jgi:hypothetical protein
MIDQELFYNLVTRDALLIHSGVAHSLEGPFDSREDAERAAEVLVDRLQTHNEQNGSRELSVVTPTTK